MAYDEILADRMRVIFSEKGAAFEEKKMMGGLCFMVDDKMCCGIHTDKKSGDGQLMLRVGHEVASAILEKGEPHVEPMDFTGRPMKDFLTVVEAGVESKAALARFIQLCLDFNPQAKSSKKKKK